MLVINGCVPATASRVEASVGSMLPYLLVDVCVEDAGFGAQVGFEGVHLVLADELPDRVVFHRVLQIAENARLGRADLDAGRLQAARDAVVAKRAFLGRLGLRVEET